MISGNSRFHQFGFEKGQYLTVTPKTLELGSPAQLLMDYMSQKEVASHDLAMETLCFNRSKKDPKDGITISYFRFAQSRGIALSSRYLSEARLLNWQRPFIRIFTLPSLAKRSNPVSGDPASI